MLRWLRGRGAKAGEVAAMQARIPPDLWRRTLHAYPFLAALSEAEQQALQARAAWLLASKNINGAHGLEITDFMRLSVAAQAALPVLNLSPTLYEGWDEIIIYPAGFSIQRERMDEDGVMHEYIEEAVGEAWEGGPVILSWSDAAGSDGAFNVVIHEFAHKLDLLAGQGRRMPALAAHPTSTRASGAACWKTAWTVSPPPSKPSSARFRRTSIRKARRPIPGMRACRWTPTPPPTRPSSSR